MEVTKLTHEIIIRASVEKTWEALSNVENLDKFDPAVKRAVSLSENKSGINVKRKVIIKDGKNWFEDIVTEFQQNKVLTYQLSNCSFPVKGLTHSYSFEKIGTNVNVKQVMHYRMKYGFLGRILNLLFIRRQTEYGINKFLEGLKHYLENESG